MAMEKYLVNYITNKTLDALIVSSMLLKYNKKKELIETKSIINTYYNNPFDLEYGFKFAILKYVENNNEEFISVKLYTSSYSPLNPLQLDSYMPTEDKLVLNELFKISDMEDKIDDIYKEYY